MPNHFNDQIIKEFRANEGRVSGPFEGARLLLLTTLGARTGAAHTVPLGYLPDEGGRILIIASAAGAPKDPAWLHNLRAHPRVTVETGYFTYEANAAILEKPERDELFARAVEASPGWGDYQAQTDRILSVIALTPIEAGPPNAASWGEALKTIHNAFRLELSRIRREVRASGPGLAAQLRVNCLSVCQGLAFHHTREDAGMFPQMLERHPELASTMKRLDEEHQRIAVLLTELTAVVRSDSADRETVLAEVERLTSELEAHLSFEEEQLVPVLDAMMPDR